MRLSRESVCTRLDAGKFLVHEHGVQERFVKARLVLLRDNENVVLLAEEGRHHFFRYGLPMHLLIEGGFRVLHIGFGFGISDRDSTGESNQWLNVRKPLFCNLTGKFQHIQHRMFSGCCNHHGLGPAAYLVHGEVREMVEHDGHFLSYGMRMQGLELDSFAAGYGFVVLRVILNFLDELVVHPVGDIVFENI